MKLFIDKKARRKVNLKSQLKQEGQLERDKIYLEISRKQVYGCINKHFL